MLIVTSTICRTRPLISGKNSIALSQFSMYASQACGSVFVHGKSARYIIALMSLTSWAPPTAASNAERPAKVRAVADPEQAVTKKLLLLVAKLGLSTAQTTRALQGAVFRTWLVPTDSDVAQLSMKAGKEYNEIQKSDATMKEITPNQYMFFRLCQLVEQENAKIGDLIEPFRKCAAGIDSPAGLKGKVLYCRLAKAWGSSNNKMYFTMIPGCKPMLDAIEHLIKVSGGEVKEGAPPPSNLEREIQKILDEIASA